MDKYNYTRSKDILIFNQCDKTDVLLSTPFIRELKKLKPGYKIHYCTKGENLKMLSNNSNIDYLYNWDFNKFKDYLKFIATFDKIYFEEIYCLNKDFKYKLLLKVINHDKILYYKNKKKSDIHEIFKHVSLLFDEKKYNPVFENREEINKYFKIDFELNKGSIKRAKSYYILHNMKFENTVCLCFGDQYNWLKEYPKDRFLDLAKNFLDLKKNVILLGDSLICKYIEDLLLLNKYDKDKIKNLSTSIDFNTQIAIINYSGLTITSDNEYLYAAGAVNPLTVGIFGPSDPVIRSPLGLDYVWEDSDKEKYVKGYNALDYSRKGIMFFNY